MSVKTVHAHSETVYFCTFTCHRWLNLFSLTNCYDQVYKWFDVLVTFNYRIIGYVIMPNHVHFLVYYPKDNKSLNVRISNGKRFIAYEMLKRLKQQKQDSLLELLSADVLPSDKKFGSLHKVFKDSFDAREILSEEMLIQKLDYTHHNPVSGKWNLVSDFTAYPHSSAKFYETGAKGGYPVVHFREL